MNSIELLDLIERIPLEESVALTSGKMVASLLGMDSTQFGIEVGLGVENALHGLFQEINVPDEVHEAFAKTFTATDMSLFEKYNECAANGEESIGGLISAIKGKVAEIDCAEMLNETIPGYHFEIASDPTQPIWDIKGVSTDGLPEMFFQVKMGSAAYAGEVVERMGDSPDVIFAVSSDIYEKITTLHPELAGRLIDMDIPQLEFTQDVQEALATLAENMGIDLPDEIGDVLPYAGEIVLAIKLIYDVVSVERDFKEIHIEDRKKIHMVKALALISRFGISSVCTIIGGAAGTIIPIPFLGTLLGAGAGALLSMFLNNKLKPHVLEISLDICKLTEDDLFYFKNKQVIDSLGASFSSTALEAA